MYEFLDRYTLEHDIRTDSAAQLRYAIDTFAKFLERPPLLADLNDDCVNRFILWLRSAGYAHETARTRRRGLLTIWRAAADAGQVAPPRRVRRLAPRHSVPRAWTPAQVAAILAECHKLTGTFRRFPHIERAKFAAAVCMTLYETGFRRGDVLRIHRHQIQPCGLIVLVQSKTGQPHLARIRPETLKLIDDMGTAGRPHVFGGFILINYLVIDNARMEAIRRNGGDPDAFNSAAASFIIWGMIHYWLAVAVAIYVVVMLVLLVIWFGSQPDR